MTIEESFMFNVHWMKQTVALAYENVLQEKGGPFAALVIKDGKIIGQGTNEVTTCNDPTAHAEIQAIRAASSYLNNFQLTDCDIYTSCEPCPMCLGAIYWARPRAVYYYSSRKDAAEVGFDDQYIYEQIPLPVHERNILMKQVNISASNQPFELWKNTNNKVEY